MAKLQKLVTVTTYRWEEVELTEEQTSLFKSNEEDFMEKYYDGEYDFDWDLINDKCLQDEDPPMLIEVEDK